MTEQVKPERKGALVTGSSRGIGRAIAALFVDEGAKVYYACRNMETGKAAVEAARARGGQAELVYFEAHDPATHRSMIDECIAKEGRLDVLVNNFGESNPRKDLDITKCTYKEFEKTVCVDLSTVFNACQEALNKAMIKQHSGSIINIGSVAAVCPDRTQVGYGVAKSGINHLSRQMARQVAHAGVRVNVLNPGIIATEAVAKHLTPETQSRYTTNCMIKHLGEPIDIAYMALYLASDESKYVTAHVMNVSGGCMYWPLGLLFISSHSSGKEPGVSRALFRSLPRKRTRTRRSRVRVFQGRKREFDLHNV